jgi:predicted metal-dependent hydrolase
MVSSKTVFMPGIGDVLLSKNKLSRGISIKVKAGGKIRVSLPWRASFSEAETFLIKKQDWIKSAIEKMAELSNSKRTIFDQNKENVTLFHHLEIATHESNQILLRVSGNIISVKHPPSIDVKDQLVQDAIKKGILFAMKREAKKYLPLRLKELAEEKGLHYNRVSIRDTKTRWGSCSGTNNINLSLHLMKLPLHLIDYVILHELAHTIHKNHSRDFWEYLEVLTENSKKSAKEMKYYSTQL